MNADADATFHAYRLLPAVDANAAALALLRIARDINRQKKHKKQFVARARKLTCWDVQTANFG